MIKIENELYEREDEFTKDMRNRFFVHDTPTTEELITHEKSHFYKARELQANPVFGVTRITFYYVFGALVFTLPRTLVSTDNYETFRAIASAPSKLSLGDKFHSSILGKLFFNYKLWRDSRK